jgi:serine/tyrosine/threonine adenylyltransferase
MSLDPLNIANVKFLHNFVDQFPGDDSYSTIPRYTPAACYALARPTPVQRPELLAWSQDLAQKFNLAEPATFSPSTDLLCGNLITDDMKPYAACYGGHQFGHWADQLGDGRAITLGEIESQTGEFWDLQLKGPGRTAYSRRADGRAVLRSSVREYIASEAMHHLGVSTTRALSLSLTGDLVMRDILYDGNPRNEPGAIVARMAPTFIRFGNFEILAARGEIESLQKLADFIVQNHFKSISLTDPNRIHQLFEQVSEATAVMIANWMRVGFVHGVMNTDNMSILGATIDYGPYGFLDNYDPNWTPNTTDLPGRRYCYGRQPKIAQWNLARLAEALLVLVPDQIEKFQITIEQFESNFRRHHFQVMNNKLGLNLTQSNEDLLWLNNLEKVMFKSEADFTHLYRAFTDSITKNKKAPKVESLQSIFYRTELADEIKSEWVTWLNDYQKRLDHSDISIEKCLDKMNAANPIYTPRNFILQEIIDAIENGDASLLQKFSEVICNPYKSQTHSEEFTRMRPDWALNKVGCSTLSCSS